MIKLITFCLAGILAASLMIILLAFVWCILLPGLILFGMKTFKMFDKFSDKLYSKFKTKE